jgi:hypothetical protein
MATFGKPSAPTGTPNTTGNGDDDFAGMGLSGDFSIPLGVYPATCVELKMVKSDRFNGVALQFTLDATGDEYSLMAPALTDDMNPKERKNARNAWLRIGQALRAMGVDVGSNQLPVQGKAAVEGQRCRLAVSTYSKPGGDTDTPTIVWNRPKLRQRDGVEVGFDPALADESGKCPDYGCGVLPPA